VLSRAARVPSYYGRKTFGRVRQELKIWGVDSPWIVAILAPTHAWISLRPTVTINGCAISLLEMRSGSSMLIIRVDVNALAAVKRELQRLKWTPTPRRWCWAFRGNQRDNWLGFSCYWVYNHRRYLLSTVESCGTTTRRKTGSNLLSPRRCECNGNEMAYRIPLWQMERHRSSVLRHDVYSTMLYIQVYRQMERHSLVSYDTMVIRLCSTSKCIYFTNNTRLYTRERERGKGNGTIS